MIKRDNRQLIYHVIEALDRAQEKYALLPSDDSMRVTDWMESKFPVASWGRILWPSVPDSTCLPWANKGADLVDAFHSLCDRQDLANPQVVVLWSNALRPGLELSLESVRRHAAEIFNADFDTWIVCESDAWCIEVYHEGELCFGRADAFGDANITS